MAVLESFNHESRCPTLRFEDYTHTQFTAELSSQKSQPSASFVLLSAFKNSKNMATFCIFGQQPKGLVNAQATKPKVKNTECSDGFLFETRSLKQQKEPWTN
jgi:hypothetical protein